MKQTFTCFCLCLITFLAFIGCDKENISTGNIYGIITDADNGQPLSAVNVVLNPSGETFSTGSDGRYEFVNLKSGQYTVQATKTDYLSNYSHVTVVANQSVSGDIRLQAIAREASIEISSTMLDFGSTQTELAISIKNSGNEAASWSVDLGNNSSWITASPMAGTIGAKKTQSLSFTVNRDKISEAKSVIVKLSVDNNSYPITINCMPKEAKVGKMEVSPSTLDFGYSVSQLSLTIKNIGEGDLNWSIAKPNTECLSLSDYSGVVVPGGSKILQVNLKRDIMPENLETTILISDGSKEENIKVKASKEAEKTGLEISPTTLDFGNSQSELAVSIKNIGDQSVDWNLDLGDNTSWLSASPSSGNIGEQKTQSIVFKVNRDNVSQQKSSIINISADGNSYSVTVKCTPSPKAVMEVSPTTLDFGTTASQLNLTIENSGEGDLNWNIANLDTEYLSVSDMSGSIAPDGNKIIQVNLKRDNMSGNLESSFIVSDGSKEVVISVKAEKSNSGSGEEGGEEDLEEDYSSASIDVSSINHLQAEILSCKRSGTGVTLTYLLTNTYSKDMAISLFRESVSDDQYNSYTKYMFTVGSSSSSYVGSLYDAKLYSNQATKATIVIQNVDSSAKKISCVVKASYAWQGSAVSTNTFKLQNVPIY